MANSSVAYVHIQVIELFRPPVPVSNAVHVEQGQKISIVLDAFDPDTVASDLRYRLLMPAQHGYADVPNNANVMTYTAVSVGVDTINWQVSDGTSTVAAVLVITVSPQPVTDTPPLKTSQVAGIVVGSVVFFIILALLIVYFIYWHVAAQRFEKQWQKEFCASQVMSNPLYSEARSEKVNPLYVSEF